MSSVPDDDEAVLLTVRAPGRDLDVAALADVPLSVLAAALGDLLGDLLGDGGSWALAPADRTAAQQPWQPREPCRPWAPGSTLRGLGVLDGSTLALVRVSGARS